jgi:hypothetical protein
MAMRRHALAWAAAAAGVAAVTICLAACGSATTGSTTSAPGSLTTTGSAPTGTAHANLSITPATGHPTSVIRFAFHAPVASGREAHLLLSYALSVTGPHGRGCVAAHGTALGPVTRGELVTATLGPAQLGGSWCVGTYTGRVDELARPVCPAGEMCPQFIRLVAVVGPASFTITA